MTERQMKHFNKTLPGEWSIVAINKQARAYAKAWRVPLGSIVIDATQTYDESPILELSASRIETLEEAQLREAEKIILRVTYSGKPCPSFDVDPVGHMAWNEFNRSIG